MQAAILTLQFPCDFDFGEQRQYSLSYVIGQSIKKFSFSWKLVP